MSMECPTRRTRVTEPSGATSSSIVPALYSRVSPGIGSQVAERVTARRRVERSAASPPLFGGNLSGADRRAWRRCASQETFRAEVLVDFRPVNSIP